MTWSFVLSSVTGSGVVIGTVLSQTTTISNDSPIALGVMVAATVFAFGVGVGLTNILRDLRVIKKILHSLACQRGKDCFDEKDLSN